MPGTLGCFARAVHDQRTVILTSGHVLFGYRGAGSDAIWLAEGEHGTHRYAPIGRALQGKIGTVRFDGDDYFVDCAVGSCLIPPKPGRLFSRVAPHGAVRPGDRVTKRGAATGTTEGIVVDIAYSTSMSVDGKTCPATRQLLVRPSSGAGPFSVEGDSGAVLVGANDAIVGLLWGVNTQGEGVACPIAPVLHAMHVALLTTAA